LCNSLRLGFKITNNEVEYEAVLAGLRLAQEMGTKCVEVRSNSQVIIGHIKGEYETKGEKNEALFVSSTRDADLLQKV
jgi:ribonuclease HI